MVDFERLDRKKLIVGLVDYFEAVAGAERIAGSAHCSVTASHFGSELGFAIDPGDAVKRGISSFAVDHHPGWSLKFGTRSYKETGPST